VGVWIAVFAANGSVMSGMETFVVKRAPVALLL
jgi:hypothetical protein